MRRYSLIRLALAAVIGLAFGVQGASAQAPWPPPKEPCPSPTPPCPPPADPRVPTVPKLHYVPAGYPGGYICPHPATGGPGEAAHAHRHAHRGPVIGVALNVDGTLGVRRPMFHEARRLTAAAFVLDPPPDEPCPTPTPPCPPPLNPTVPTVPAAHYVPAGYPPGTYCPHPYVPLGPGS